MLNTDPAYRHLKPCHVRPMRLWPREASMRKVYKPIRFLVNYSFTTIFFADLTPNSEGGTSQRPPRMPPGGGPRYLEAPRPLGDDLQIGIEQAWMSACAQQGKLNRRANGRKRHIRMPSVEPQGQATNRLVPTATTQQNQNLMSFGDHPRTDGWCPGEDSNLHDLSITGT